MKRKRKRGRPSKFNPKQEEQVLELIKQGYTHTEAAQKVGIHVSTLSRWKRKIVFGGKVQDAFWEPSSRHAARARRRAKRHVRVLA